MNYLIPTPSDLEVNLLKDVLMAMKTELNKYKRDRTSLDILYIQQRLDHSLQSYQEELEDSLTYLQNRNELNLIKKMSRTL